MKKNETKNALPEARRKGAGEKKERRFNVLDGVLLLMLAAAIVLIVAVYFPVGFLRTFGDRVTLTYTVEIEGVSADMASKIAIGDKVTDENGFELGTVAAEVEVDPYPVIGYDAVTGEVAAYDHPLLSNLLITVTVSAVSDPQTGYTADGQRIAVGAGYTLVLPGFEGTGRCIGLAELTSSEGGAD